MCQRALKPQLRIKPSSTYRKVPKFSDARKLCYNNNLPKIQTTRPSLRVFLQKDANAIANSQDPDQTAPLGAVLSGSSLFAQTCLSENLGLLRYCSIVHEQPSIMASCQILRWSFCLHIYTCIYITCVQTAKALVFGFCSFELLLYGLGKQLSSCWDGQLSYLQFTQAGLI